MRIVEIEFWKLGQIHLDRADHICMRWADGFVSRANDSIEEFVDAFEAPG